MSEHIIKSHNKTLILYHLVCPAKYRRKAFTPAVASSLTAVCLEIADCYDIRFVEIGTDQDHVHFLIQTVPTLAPSTLAKIVKSITGRELFRRHPEVKRMLWGGAFWTSGYYLNTVGAHGNETVIAQYVKNQGREYEQLHRQQALFEL